MEAPEGQPSWPRGIAGRVLLVALTLWALATIVPDFYRAVDPLAAFGLSVDNDGVVIDTIAPFASEAELPAARADIVPGDRVDLRAMRCIPRTRPCATTRWCCSAGSPGCTTSCPAAGSTW